MKWYLGKLWESDRVLSKFVVIFETEIEHGREINEPKVEAGKDIGLKFKLSKLEIEIKFRSQIETGNVFQSRKTQGQPTFVIGDQTQLWSQVETDISVSSRDRNGLVSVLDQVILVPS